MRKAKKVDLNLEVVALVLPFANQLIEEAILWVSGTESTDSRSDPFAQGPQMRGTVDRRISESLSLSGPWWLSLFVLFCMDEIR